MDGGIAMSYIEKLESYKFENMLMKPTYGEDIVRSELSMGAYELIHEWERGIFFNKNFLKDYCRLKNIPMYEKVIDFFCIYGGRIFCYQDSSIYNDTIKFNKGYRIQSFPERVEEKDGNVYYSCMDYHYAGDFGPHIDQYGKIYSFCMGEYHKKADNMAEFMEQEFIEANENRKRLSNISSGSENNKYYVCNRKMENIWQSVYEYLISHYTPEIFEMLEILMPLIAEKKIVLRDERINELMEIILENSNISEILIIDMLEFLSSQNHSSKTMSIMIDVVSRITLIERKEQFLIDKLIEWEHDYPDVKNKILSLL